MKASPILANVSPVVASPLVPYFPDRLGKTEATKGQSATKGQYLLSTYCPLVAPRGVDKKCLGLIVNNEFQSSLWRLRDHCWEIFFILEDTGEAFYKATHFLVCVALYYKAYR